MKVQQLNSKFKKNIRLSGIEALIAGAAKLFSGCENNMEEIKTLA